ncbi:uncharacterized protein C8R40DRAFT_753809 [Lentinula edodes]|uniref:uncharacterized protein n=1 Tax=Lentinula edodes TaxID=5353 RepID=UPI001E8D2D20|nr:uncharacterized protein C8R40DRAFT_753809 [Lentinula edodes]KAH7869072.1 hypothetical protein C8R40DRAFT_753809 [Lentinula edodes]
MRTRITFYLFIILDILAANAGDIGPGVTSGYDLGVPQARGFPEHSIFSLRGRAPGKDSEGGVVSPEDFPKPPTSRISLSDFPNPPPGKGTIIPKIPKLVLIAPSDTESSPASRPQSTDLPPPPGAPPTRPLPPLPLKLNEVSKGFPLPQSAPPNKKLPELPSHPLANLNEVSPGFPPPQSAPPNTKLPALPSHPAPPTRPPPAPPADAHPPPIPAKSPLRPKVNPRASTPAAAMKKRAEASSAVRMLGRLQKEPTQSYQEGEHHNKKRDVTRTNYRRRIVEWDEKL